MANNQQQPAVKVGDKVRVMFEEGSRLTGTITGLTPFIEAKFGRGEDAFTSAIYWASWDSGRHFSWKEDAHTVRL